MSEISVSYDGETAARIAEACLKYGCPQAIPGFLRYGLPPELVEAELNAAEKLAHDRGIISARPTATPDVLTQIEQAARKRFGNAA